MTGDLPVDRLVLLEVRGRAGAVSGKHAEAAAVGMMSGRSAISMEK
jgi:hypothetical protein